MAADCHCSKIEKGERSWGEKRKMSGSDGKKGLDLLAVILYRWSKGTAMNTSDEQEGRKPMQLDLWLAGTPTWMFSFGSSPPPAHTFHLQRAEGHCHG